MLRLLYLLYDIFIVRKFEKKRALAQEALSEYACDPCSDDDEEGGGFICSAPSTQRICMTPPSEEDPSSVILGDVLGEGAYGAVYKRCVGVNGTVFNLQRLLTPKHSWCSGAVVKLTHLNDSGTKVKY